MGPRRGLGDAVDQAGKLGAGRTTMKPEIIQWGRTERNMSKPTDFLEDLLACRIRLFLQTWV